MTNARQAKKNTGKRKASGIDGDLGTITAAVLREIEGVEAISLFGSLARGDADTGAIMLLQPLWAVCRRHISNQSPQ